MRTTARRITSIAAATATAAALAVGAAGTASAQEPAEGNPIYGSLAAAGLTDEDGTLTPIGQSVTTPLIMGSAAAFFGVCFSMEITNLANCPT